MAEQYLGEPEFFSSSQIRDFCKRGRDLMRPIFNELHISAAELQAVLKHIESANPSVFGLDSRLRARLVSKHMSHAADAVEVASASLVRCYASFRHHYVKELRDRTSNAPRRQFKFDD